MMRCTFSCSREILPTNDAVGSEFTVRLITEAEAKDMARLLSGARAARVPIAAFTESRPELGLDDGSEDRLYENFPSYSLYPPTAGLHA
jgi:hypothetical protein